VTTKSCQRTLPITGIGRDAGLKSELQNFEGWFRIAQAFNKKIEYIPSAFEIQYSIFAFKIFSNQGSFTINRFASQASGWADT